MALTKISTAMISQSAAAVDLNVDAGTFYVDTTNNRVGVGGKTDPDTPLHVIGTVTATTFAGSGASLTNIPNSALTNSSITINSNAVSLGGSLTLTTANIGENTNLYYTDARADARIAAADTDDLSEGSSNLYYTDARVDARVSGGSLGNITTTGYIRGPATFTLDPAAHGDNTGTVVIAGNLQVDGTTTTINSTTMTVDDKNITLASGSANAAAASGAGFTVDIGSGTNPTITYDGTNDTWDFNKSLHISGAAGSGVKIDSGGAIVGGGATGGDTQLMYWGGGPVYYGRSSLGGTVTGHEFRVGGVTKLNVNSSGNTIASGNVESEGLKLNVNTSMYTQNASLSYYSSTNGVYLNGAGNNGWLRLNASGTQNDGVAINLFGSAAGNLITLKTNTAERMRINSSGNVGIGTSTGVSDPVSRLNVRAANNHTTGSDREDLVTFHQGISAWQVGRGAGIRWVGDVSRTMAGISTYIFGTEQTGLAFETGGATSTGNLDPTTRMVIDHNGNVGIGTASPSANLHIDGDGTYATIRGYSQVLDLGNWTNGEVRIESTGAPFHLRAAGNQPIHLETNNVERVSILGTGNVGIGEVSPDSKLHVKDATNISASAAGAGQFRVEGSGYTTSIAMDATRAHIYHNSSLRNLSFGTDESIDMTIKGSNGFVGIGTESPATKLNVKHTGVTGVRIETDGDDDANFIHFKTLSSSSQGYIGNESSTAAANFTGTTARAFVVGSTSSGTNTQFLSAGTVKVTILSGGNVGIGSSAPAAKLQVSISDATNYSSVEASETTPVGTDALYLYNEETTSTNGKTSIFMRSTGSGGNATARITLKNERSGGGSLRFLFRDSAHTANMQEKMVITSGGRLGISTDAPNARLHVKSGGTGNVFYVESSDGHHLGGFYQESDTRAAFNVRNASGTATINLDSGGNSWFTGGSVGIGTASPTSTLDLTNASDTAERAIRIENSSARLYVGVEGSSGNRFVSSSTNNAFIGTTTDDGLELATANTVRAIITNGGDVGIGTTSPGRQLEIFKAGSAGAYRLKVKGDTGHTGIEIENTSSSNTNILFRNPSYTQELYMDTSGKFHVYNTNGSLLTVQQDGKVGIGTASPAQTLHVDSSSGAVIRVSRIATSAGAYGQLEHDGTDTTLTSTGATKFYNNSGYSLTIDSSNNVGIGNTNPSAYGKFVVSGAGNILNLNATSGVAYQAFYENGTGRFYFGTLNGSDGLAFIDADGATKRMVIDDSGRIGIGVTPNGSNDMDDVILQFPSNYAIGGAYSSFGETASGQSTIIGNNIRAEVGANNQVVRHISGSDAGNFLKLTYNQGFTIHTGITSTLGTGVDHTINERVRVDTSGNVGIGTDSPGRLLDIGGSGAGGVVGIKGGNNNQVNIAHSSNTAYGLLLGNSDNSNNGGYHYSTSGSNTSVAMVNVNNDALHIGTNNAARLTIDHNGNTSIGTHAGATNPIVMHNAVTTVSVRGPIASGYSGGTYAQGPRNTRDWFVYAGPPTNSGQYVHMKTNLWAGGGATGNTEYTMSSFRYHSYYAYGGSTTPGGIIGWHNWAGSFYNVHLVNEGNLDLVQNSYVSSDGYCVLVAKIGAGYAQFSIDWMQWAGYTFRERKVTAVTQSSSATGAY